MKKQRCAATWKQAEYRLHEELPAEWEQGNIDKEMLANMGRKVRERIADIKKSLQRLDGQLRDSDRLANSLEDLSTMDEAMRRVALRAVSTLERRSIPSNKPRQRSAETGYKWQTDPDAGRVVWLTAWGTLHTATIERKPTDDHRTRLCFLRPASARGDHWHCQRFALPGCLFWRIGALAQKRRLRVHHAGIRPRVRARDKTSCC